MVVPFVGLSVLMFTLLMVILAGILVLLGLESTHYNHRGGVSDNGSVCGAFYVFGGLAFSHASWNHGAARS